MNPSDVTLVENAIHNPNEPRHFMEVAPAGSERTAVVGNRILARSSESHVVKEVGFHIYDPVVYFPRADVDMGALSRIDKTTHCPLKGDTEYFDVVVDGQHLAEAAWSYVESMEAASVLRDLIAFDTSRIAVA